MVTLILTWVDPEFTVHVADRRISLAHADGRIEPRDDLGVKTILVGGSLLCSCSGVAEFRTGQTLPAWFAERLAVLRDAGYELGDALGEVAADLDRLLTGPFRDQPLTINVSGWSIAKDKQLVPVIGIVTNLDDGGEPTASSFGAMARTFPGGSGWTTHGLPLTPSASAELQRLLRRGRRQGSSGYAAARLFVQLLRRQAEHSKLVSKAAIVSVLPRTSLPPSPMEGAEIDLFVGTGGKLLAGAAMITEILDDGDLKVFRRA
jgi:hypothetical protein